jgi:hypothetical protein
MTENLTNQYEGYAVYLPSLQQQFATFATKTNADVKRRNGIPKGFKTQSLNFLQPDNKLWHCAYTLYSCGQFDKPQIRSRDIVAERDRQNSVVVGDSGGFQLGTGAIRSKDELKHLERYKNDPAQQFKKWQHCGFRERTLKWLERYTDYAMTLDMVLWAAEKRDQPTARGSQLRKLSVQQLIDLSVENLRFFSDNRGRETRTTKFLSVLQDIGDGTGEAWYQAVKSFKFEGWALGSETGGLLNSMYWLRRLLNDGNLDCAEWIHTLGKSPPLNSIIYTAAQRALRRILGRENFTISLDSSSPHRIAGVQRSLVVPCHFTNDEKTWKISAWQVPQDIRLARGEKILDFPFASPFAKHMKINDLLAHDRDDSDYFTDPWAENILVSHNIYTYHRASIDACDLIFHEQKQDWSRVPGPYAEIVELVDQYFSSETPSLIEERLAKLLKQSHMSGPQQNNLDCK